MSLAHIKESCENNKVPTFTEELIFEDLDLRSQTSLCTLTRRVCGLPHLHRLSVRKSHLTASGLAALVVSLSESLPTLKQLDISFNDFYRIEEFQPLTLLTTLQSLDISNCPLCSSIHDWRVKVLVLLPWLRFLNGEPSLLTRISDEHISFNQGGQVLEKCENSILEGGRQGWVQSSRNVDCFLDDKPSEIEETAELRLKKLLGGALS